MIETIDIIGLNSLEEHHRFWGILLSMYDEFLIRDRSWHFFYEGDYNHIRCNSKYMEKVSLILTSNNFKISTPVVWLDGSDYVECYKEEFIDLFHSFSVLAVKMYLSGKNSKEDMVNTLDRIYHCSANHMFYNAIGNFTVDGVYDNRYEVSIASSIFTARALQIGTLYGGNRFLEVYGE